MKLQFMQTSMTDSSVCEDFTQVLDVVSELIQTVRTLTYDLNVPVSKSLGFTCSVRVWLKDHIEGRHGVPTEFRDDGRALTLQADQAAILYRNVRELVNNAVKHAQPGKVEVSLQQQAGHVIVTVADDGCGFDVNGVFNESSSLSGYGLFSVQERMTQIGGAFQVDSEPGQGCRAVLRLPLSFKC